MAGLLMVFCLYINKIDLHRVRRRSSKGSLLTTELQMIFLYKSPHKNRLHLEYFKILFLGCLIFKMSCFSSVSVSKIFSSGPFSWKISNITTRFQAFRASFLPVFFRQKTIKHPQSMQDLLKFSFPFKTSKRFLTLVFNRSFVLRKHLKLKKYIFQSFEEFPF